MVQITQPSAKEAPKLARAEEVELGSGARGEEAGEVSRRGER